MTTVATSIPAAPKWDLESIFPGGSASPEFKAFREKMKAEIAAGASRVSTLPNQLDKNSREQWKQFIVLLQDLHERLELIRSFGGCLIAQNVADNAAQGIVGESDQMTSEWEKLRTFLEAWSIRQSDAAWNDLVSDPALVGFKFFLDETRETARHKMPIEKESLALDLSVNGYHAWNRLYDRMAGDLRVKMEVGGETKELSMGQLATYMDNPDRNVRRTAFEKMTEAWKSRADLAAMTLNAQAGFRLALYKNRGWQSPLIEPLMQNRLSQASLDAMWSVVARETKRLAPYIEAKKKLLGIDAFRWYDEFASVGEVHRKWSFDEAVEFIVTNCRSFSDHLADYCKMAVEKRWIEAEDRAGKAGGAFCTTFGIHRQSRIFMTYSGTYDNLSTLAHELGHAYHSHVLRDKAWLAGMYPMGLAETASIFNELLTTDSALASAQSRDERLMLLDQLLMQPYVFFTDVHCRYIFDRAFYAEREKRILDAAGLCEMMTNAQRQAYQGLLAEDGYHPYFWASKLHFFITDTPFYNFPYVFGFLFAGGVYNCAREEGKSFADKYRALLADTGSMTTEQVAKKHLGVDLTKEDFWVASVNRSLSKVDEFVKLANQK
ncbi:MAG: M3 family oligoendopeptidase [bacterium]|nr:M3 family oligoendopeptidase [bacterium]